MSHPTDVVVITCAMTGAGSRESLPQIPATPESFANEARRVWNAGASVVHLHGRDPDTGLPSHKVSHLKAIVHAVRDAAPELLINVTTGGGLDLTPEERAAPAIETGADFGTISMGSLNIAAYDRGARSFRQDLVFGNSFATISYFLQALTEARISIDYEFYELGHVANYDILADQGLIGPGVCSLILGVEGAAAATVSNLVNFAQALPRGAHWEIVSPGLRQWAMIGAALAMGGSARVGFEDNPYLAPDVAAKSNGALVEKAVRLAGELGRPVATPEVTRSILGFSQVEEVEAPRRPALS
jgi:3-keto-5-aminohexanoate cleavage enzyme